MATQRETRRQRRIRKALEKDVGGYWWKQHGSEFTPAGLPDLIGCVCGLFIGIEVKEPDSDEPEGSDIQQFTAKQIRAEGGKVLVGCITEEEAISFVKAVLDDAGIVLPKRRKRKRRPANLASTGRPPKKRRRVRTTKT